MSKACRLISDIIPTRRQITNRIAAVDVSGQVVHQPRLIFIEDIQLTMMTALQQRCLEFDLTIHRQLTLSLISDTHGTISPEVLSVVEQSDVVLHAGDIMGGAVLRSLKPRSGIVIGVLGNNDFTATWDCTDHSLLSSLSESVIVHCPGGDIAMEHGHRIPRIEIDHYALAYKYEKARAVIYGHTHIQRVDDELSPWLINPGAAGATRNRGGASCCVLSIDGDEWQYQQYKFPAVRKAG